MQRNICAAVRRTLTLNSGGPTKLRFYCEEEVFVALFRAHRGFSYFPTKRQYVCEFSGEKAVEEMGTILKKGTWGERDWELGQKAFVETTVTPKGVVAFPIRAEWRQRFISEYDPDLGKFTKTMGEPTFTLSYKVSIQKSAPQQTTRTTSPPPQHDTLPFRDPFASFQFIEIGKKKKKS
jgi:hypothetical protein